jgi:isopentenyldiphosphate isomerase
MKERTEVIDESYKTLRIVDREIVVKDNLKHKVVFIILKNSKNLYYVMQRSKNKEIYPMLWNMGAGGGVQAHESYENAAKREFKEELGIEAEPRFLFNFDYKCSIDDYKSKVFLVFSDLEVILDKVECHDGSWKSKQEIIKMISLDKFCPDSALIANKFFEEYD